MLVKDINENSIKRGVTVLVTKNKDIENTPPENFIELSKMTELKKIGITKLDKLKEFFNYEIVLSGIMPITDNLFMVIREVEKWEELKKWENTKN